MKARPTITFLHAVDTRMVSMLPLPKTTALPHAATSDRTRREAVLYLENQSGG